MDEFEDFTSDIGNAGGKSKKKPREFPWRWLPPVGFALLVAVYFLTLPGETLNKFAFFVGIGLIPGLILQLLRRNAWNVHRICFAAALVCFVLDNPSLRPDKGSWTRIRENWHAVALGFILSFTQPLWGMLRTHRLLLDGGVVITMFNSLKLCLSGSFFNIFLPGSTGGDAYRIYAITDGYKQRLAPAIASITLDRVLGLPSLILVVLLGMALDYDFFLGNRILSSLIPFLAASGVACLIILVYLMFAGKSGRRIARMDFDSLPMAKPPGRLKRMHLRISSNIKRPGTLPLALLYGFMSHIACIAACQCFGSALGVAGVPMRRYYLIIPMVMTINSIPGAPGGVGQGELAMATLLDMAAPGQGNAQSGVMVMLLFRLSNMAMGVLGGIFYAIGKTELVGLDHVSQGVTRIIRLRISDTVIRIRKRPHDSVTKRHDRTNAFRTTRFNFDGSVADDLAFPGQELNLSPNSTDDPDSARKPKTDRSFDLDPTAFGLDDPPRSPDRMGRDTRPVSSRFRRRIKPGSLDAKRSPKPKSPPEDK